MDGQESVNFYWVRSPRHRPPAYAMEDFVIISLCQSMCIRVSFNNKEPAPSASRPQFLLLHVRRALLPLDFPQVPSQGAMSWGGMRGTPRGTVVSLHESVRRPGPPCSPVCLCACLAVGCVFTELFTNSSSGIPRFEDFVESLLSK